MNDTVFATPHQHDCYDRYLKTLVAIQQELLADYPLDLIYQRTLRRLGQASGASRVYIFENNRDAADRLVMCQRAEWCNVGISLEIDNSLLQNLCYADYAPYWGARLSQGEIINELVADLPSPEREILAAQGILAFLVLPLTVEGEFWGFLGFDNCQAARPWDAAEVALLQSAAAALSLKLEQLQAATRQRQQLCELQIWQNRYEAAGRASGQVLYEWDLSQDRVTWGPNLQVILGYPPLAAPQTLQDWVACIHPDDRLTVQLALSVHPLSQEVRRQEYRIRHYDGHWLWIEDKCCLLAAPGGQPQRLVGFIANISDRKLVEQTLCQSQCLPTLITDNLPGSVYRFCVNKTGRITFLYVSDREREVSGLEPEHIVANSDLFFDIMHPDDRAQFLAKLQRAIATHQESDTFEYRIVNQQGQQRWLQDTIRFTRLASGDIIGDGVTLDVTKRKQAEVALQRSEAWFRAIFEQAAVAMVQVHWSGRLLQVNQRFCDLTGYSSAELLAGNYQDLTHPDDLAVEMELTRQLFAGDIESFSLEKRFIRRDGVVRWGYLTVSLVREAAREHQSEIGIIEDITDRKRTEAALRDSEAQSRAIFEQAAVGIARTDLKGYFLQVNQRLCDFLHYTEATFLAAPTERVASPAEDQPQRSLFNLIEATERDCLNRYWRRLLAGEIPSFSLEKRFLRQDGVWLWMNLSVALVRDVNGTPEYTIAVFEDIHDRKQAEAALRLQAQRERALNSVIQTIHNSLDLDRVFHTAITEIANLLAVDRAAIVQYRPDEARWRQVASYQCCPNSVLGVQIDITDLGNPIADRLKRREIVQIDSTIHDWPQSQEAAYTELLARFPGNWLLVPLYFGEATEAAARPVWGSLSLCRLESLQPWQPLEIELAVTIATQLAIAIQQSELYQQVQTLNVSLEAQVQERTLSLQRALEFEALVKHITDKVRDTLDEHQILQTAVESLTKTLQLDGCNAGIYDEALLTSTIAFEYTQTLPPAQGKVVALADYGDLYRQVLKGQSLQVCWRDVDSVRPGKQDYTVLICPMYDDQGPLGDLWLFKLRTETTVFDTLEIFLAEQVASQCAIAIRQARLYKAAQAQVQELERLNYLKDDFLSTVSHELRSPMANIKMSIQMLEVLLRQANAFAGSNHRMEQYFHILQHECEREITLINDLLDLSRLEAGNQPLDLAMLNLEDWIHHVSEPFLQQAAQHQQQLIVTVSPEIPPVTTDFACLGRVLTELLTNACKYTPAGEQIRIDAHLATGNLLIVVSNSGVDLPPAEVDRIFDKFYRIPSNDPWKHGGTGLGLTLVKRLVEHLQGTITVKNANHCLNFTITLPLHCPLNPW
ncbi:PAS domain S-box protein [Trichothermofontia sp.]